MSMPASPSVHEITVDESLKGERLDRVLALALPSLSRSRLQRLIAERHVLVDGAPAKAGRRMRGGEQVAVEEPEPVALDLLAEDIPLHVVFEDDDLLVVNKAAGMVVHPGPGHQSGTLVHALLGYRARWSSIGGVERPGIVHRLDKGTSGLLAVACHDRSHRHLSEQLAARTMRRVYLTLVWGRVKEPRGEVDAPIGRHPRKRQQMGVNPERGRHAVTHYRVLDFFATTTLLEVRLETGRTHQVRVHLAHLGHGVVGDATYRRGAVALRDFDGNAVSMKLVTRPLLHAAELSLQHPSRGSLIHCSAPMPLDMRKILRRLQGDRSTEE